MPDPYGQAGPPRATSYTGLVADSHSDSGDGDAFMGGDGVSSSSNDADHDMYYESPPPQDAVDAFAGVEDAELEPDRQDNEPELGCHINSTSSSSNRSQVHTGDEGYPSDLTESEDDDFFAEPTPEPEDENQDEDEDERLTDPSSGPGDDNNLGEKSQEEGTASPNDSDDAPSHRKHAISNK